MRCRHARLAIEQRLDDRLGLERGFELDRHLEDCETCAAASERAMQLEDGLSRLPEPPLHGIQLEDAVLSIRARLDSDQVEPLRASNKPMLAIIGVAAAALFLIWILRDTSPGNSTPGSPDEPIASVDEQRTEPIIPIVTTPVLDEPPIEPERVKKTREEIQGFLLAAIAPLREGNSTAKEFSAAFDELSAPLRRSDWPVLRSVESLLGSPDAQAAEAAARYLGVRGDRISRRRLLDALDREEIALEVVRALADAGDAGVPGLARALEVPALREIAGESLIALNSEEAASAVAGVLEDEREASPDLSDEELVNTLVAMQELGVRALIDLGHRQVLGMEELLDALRDIPAAGSLLALSLIDTNALPRSLKRDLPTRLRCAAQLAPASASTWMIQNLHERRWSEFVLRELPKVQGPALVNALMELDEDARLSTSDLDDLVRKSLELDAGRFSRAIEQHQQLSNSKWAETLATRLISAETSAAIAPMRLLVTSAQLSTPHRQELVLGIGEAGDTRDEPLLLDIFDGCTEDQRQLAACCLIALERIGGEPAVLAALEGATARTQTDLLSLLRRRKAGKRVTPSIYKLARELRPMLSSRTLATRNTSS